VQVNNAQDMTAHINTIEKLQKLLQLMQGEATEITENKTDNKNLFDSVDFNSLFEKKLN
jgi:lipid A disaccharide synthetase